MEQWYESVSIGWSSELTDHQPIETLFVSSYQRTIGCMEQGIKRYHSDQEKKNRKRRIWFVDKSKIWLEDQMVDDFLKKSIACLWNEQSRKLSYHIY